MSTVDLLGSHNNKKWAPRLRTVEETTKLLKSDSGACLEELKLCWREPGKIKKDTISAGLLHKRNLASLEKAIKKTRSNIKRLSIGWKHGGGRKSLIQLLEVFVNQAGRPALKDLDSIELVLGAWVPDTTLLQVLMPYAPQLKTLHIQATRMKIRTKRPTRTITFKNTYQSVHSAEYVFEEESVVKLLATPQLACQLTNLTTLSFVDCDILDNEVNILVRFLWHQYSHSGLAALSLRSNRHMTSKALQRIVQAPVSERLDLSLCDITNGGALAIARAFQQGNRASWRGQNNVILKELSMRGNYRLDERGIVPLARTCPSQVQKWDLSYCEWNEHQTCVLLDEMTPSMMARSCPLKELIIEGAKISNVDACRSIRKMLQGNRSLIKMTFHDLKYPMPVSVPNLQTIVQGLSTNYVLQELQLDLHSLKRQEQLFPNSFESACNVRRKMDFYLKLNSAGRSLLLQSHLEREAWVEALLKARQFGRLDLVYWLLRNGVVTLF